MSYLKKIKLLAPIIIAVFVSACSVVPSIPHTSYKNSMVPFGNRPLDSFANRFTRASFESLNLQSNASEPDIQNDRPFVGVALSGGGSRAAMFSLAVLKELQEAGILQHVTALSTVSGGSITGAHFALHYPTYEDAYWTFARQKLMTNFRDQWLVKYFSPWNLVRSALTDYDRTDALAAIYDDALFNEASFGALGGVGYYRPVLLINATKVNNPPWPFTSLSTRVNEGTNARFSGFTFTLESFSALGSNLTAYPIANAVAASSAFPLVFNPVTLAQFPPNTIDFVNFRHTLPAVPHGYLHLIDGGVSDNLGVDALITAATAHKRLRRVRSKPTEHACLFLVVDADVDRRTRQDDRARDIRQTPLDHLIDESASYAFDSLFARRREDTLKMLGIELSRRKGADYDRSIDNKEIALGQNGWNGPPGFAISDESTEKDVKSVDCTTWHISLAEVYSLNKPVRDRNKTELDYQEKLWAVANSIRTDLKLTGVGSCTADFISDRLADAAKVLVNEDYRSRQMICTWFKRNEIYLDKLCAANVDAGTEHSKFDIYPWGNRAEGVPATLATCAPQEH